MQRLKALAQLSTQATLGLTGLAENVQGNVYKAVASFFGPLGLKFIDGTPGRSLAFAPQNQWIAQGMNHLELLRRPEVTRQLVAGRIGLIQE